MLSFRWFKVPEGYFPHPLFGFSLRHLTHDHIYEVMFRFRLRTMLIYVNPPRLRFWVR